LIRLEETPARRLEVIGALNSAALHLLVRALEDGPVVLDLSEVSQADERAVRLLARLPAETCTLAGCPNWLSGWLERVRRATAGVAGGETT
jgi:anti-anti-sigma regulatory factor